MKSRSYIELAKLIEEFITTDFSLIRTALTVVRVVNDLTIDLTEPTPEGECRGTCPKCNQIRSFALNINTNRFNCFNKGCILKGGGVIDLVAKLYEIPAKEASHFLACAYGIQPYSPASRGASQPVKSQPVKTANSNGQTKPTVSTPQTKQPNREVVSRQEFEALQSKVERLSTLVWSMMFESGEISETDQLFDEEYQPDKELETVLAG